MDEHIPLGAHLITRRPGYVHHGIYIGSGRVVHYGWSNRRLSLRGEIKEVSLTRFCKGRTFEVKAAAAAAFATEEVIGRARSRLGETRYRLLSNNCEHFCEWCVTGAARSTQAEPWLRRYGRLKSGLARLASMLGHSAVQQHS